jgi:hypothetical protein
MFRRMRVPTAIAVALVLLIAGCSSGAAGPSPVAAPPTSVGPTAVALAADPAEAIQQAAANTLATTGGFVSLGRGPLYRQTPIGVPDGFTSFRLDGHFDGGRGLVKGAGEVAGTALEMVVTPDASFVLDKPGSWIRVDQARVPAGSAYAHLSLGASVLSGATDVRRGRAGRYEGALDLRVAAREAANPAIRPALQRLARGVEPVVEFDAVVDDQGRLTHLEYVINVDADYKWEFETSFSALGQPVSIEPPPTAQVRDAPDSFYRSFVGR